MSSVDPETRQQVEERAKGYCEYCLAPEIVGVSMTVEHIIPRVLGGGNDLSNLCLACIRCNGSKYEFISGIDPETKEEVPLFNPRTDDWYSHFSFSDDYLEIVGVTSIGRATVARLKMNIEKRKNYRKAWIELNLFPPQRPD